ncbi:MAG TPA: ankyrin repeat domain-containing protein [Tepidisphaeraceae bacterium]|jgi:peptide-methionine (S)-S-oxide reductase|nr:ankyrin repeat domain-containing protein [Tepidisphaeraceae bacterium]
MSTSNGPSSSSPPPPRRRLPVKPSIENLKKQAKRLAKLEAIQLADAQHRLARGYGCRNWAELMRVVEVMNRGADQTIDVKREVEPLPRAVRARDVAKVRAILTGGDFTQHDLDAGLANAVWYGGDAPEVVKVRRELFDLLLDHGADPDGQYGSGYGPIVFGVGEGLDVLGLQWLLDAGCDVTFPPVDTKYGATCPLVAWTGTYVRGHNDAKHRGIDLLLQHGAYVPPELSPPVLAIHRGDAKQLADLLNADRALISKRITDMPHGNIRLAGATLLHCAVEFGEIECCEELLKRYADVNARADMIDGVGGQTPIFHAINTNGDRNLYMLEYLAARVGQHIDMSVRATWRGHAGWAVRDFDPTRTPMTPLEYAEKAARDIDPKHAHYKPRAIEELTIVRALDRRHAIAQAAARDDVQAVRTMIDADQNLLTPALWPPAIFQAKSLEMVTLLLDSGLDPNECSAPRKPLHLAADRGLVDVLRLLMSRGARLEVVDGENITPYELAFCGLATPPNVEAVRQVLREGGAVDTVFTHIYLGNDDAAIAMLRDDSALADARGPIGFTALQTAARAGRVAVIDALLAMGVAADSPTGVTNTPLWLACQSSANEADRIAIASRLLSAGANPRRECEDRSTPLHFAAWRGPLAMVELLLRHNAKEWLRDKNGKSPINYARDGGVAADREQIIELLDRPVIRDPHFKSAVQAVHAGDLATLKRLLSDHPNLASDAAEEPECYQPGYFKDPKLLWFVANNPTLMAVMPANIVDCAAAIIDAGAKRADLDYTLELVMTSDPARDQGLQQPLMALLLSRGAQVTPHAIHITLGHALREPVQAMVNQGLPMTASIAAGLGRNDDLTRLLPTADAGERHAALSMACINRQHEAARLCLDAGADANAFLLVHVHSTPLHQAAIHDDVEMLKLLVASGANLNTYDTLWNSTPLGWAIHENKPTAAAYLRSIGAT